MAKKKTSAKPQQKAKAPAAAAQETVKKGADYSQGPMFLKGELCPFCNKKTLQLMESETDIPYFGRAYLFAMDCENPECGYHKADVESAEETKGPVKYTLDITSEEDMKIRIVKSSTCTIKIPHIGSVEPGEAANGYVTNVEGLLQRMKKQIEHIRDDPGAEEDEKKKAKNLLKKIIRIMWGQESVKLTLDDPNGNSAIISPKAVKTK
jgi:zinc finger protein